MTKKIILQLSTFSFLFSQEKIFFSAKIRQFNVNYSHMYSSVYFSVVRWERETCLVPVTQPTLNRA